MHRSLPFALALSAVATAASAADELRHERAGANARITFTIHGEQGIALFVNGKPIDGDITSRLYLWDAGTEVNEEPGSGPNQAPRQAAANTGPAEHAPVRRIEGVEDGFTYPAVDQVLRVTITPGAPAMVN